MRIEISELDMVQYVALETFIASDENKFHVQGIGRGNSESREGPATLYKLIVDNIGNTEFDKKKGAQKYKDITVNVNSDMLSRDEVHALMAYLHFPSDYNMGRRSDALGKKLK